MSAWRRAGVWLGLIEDETDAAYDEREPAPTGREVRRGRTRGAGSRYDYDDYEDEDDVPVAVSRGDGSRPTERVTPSTRPARRPERDPSAGGVVHPITRDLRDARGPTVSYLTHENLALAPELHHREHPVAASENDRRYQITTLHPTTYREARTIGEHFRDGTPVIMNLTEMDEADARRLVDFGAGLAFGLRGTMERVTNRVFLLSPANVHVTAEDKAKIAEGELFHHR